MVAGFLKDWHEASGGKPLAISEYAFTATDERLLACHLSHFSQQERAEKARQFTSHCLDLPFVVGMHWFQYYDQPITGRALGDGERGNFGIVDVCDRVYPEMTAVLKECGARLYYEGQTS